ncbi:VOC family protein [Streptomyces sp. NPDC005731]|uniref:VOC family protein n=1 Tax=Streptomyces sp. NPDC005731 TaxID=3157056 RepID=UPI003401BF05
MDIDLCAPGAPSWVELTTPDAHTSGDFYRELFGWQLSSGMDEKDDSQTCLLRARPVAAITSVPEAEHSAWTIYFHVADTDVTAAAVAAAGGRAVSPPQRVGQAGRTALFADHAGTVFGVWEPADHQGAGVIIGEPGALHRGELITDDVEASAVFYGAVFGWKLAAPQGPLGRRDWILGDTAVAVLLPRPPAMPADVPPYWDVYFSVADASEASRTAENLGAALLMPATPTEHGAIAVLVDPVGAVFTVIAPHR